MRITEAKEIPLENLVVALGGTYTHRRGKDMWFKSPFRPGERTASFKVDVMRNRWHDFGHSGGSRAGGDIIDLWCEYYNLDRKSGIKDALHGLARFGTNPLITNRFDITQTQAVQGNVETPRFEIIKLHNRIYYPPLLEEVSRRKISPQLANLYLKQAWIKDNQYPNRKLNGFAFANTKKGWEISIPNPAQDKSFKNVIGAKAISFVQGQAGHQVDVFEGFWDFLTWLQMNSLIVPRYDTYILNGATLSGYFINAIEKELHHVKCVMEFLDNDSAGEAARMHLANEFLDTGILFGSRNHVYRQYKDLNEHWINLR